MADDKSEIERTQAELARRERVVDAYRAEGKPEQMINDAQSRVDHAKRVLASLGGTSSGKSRARAKSRADKPAASEPTSDEE